MFSTSGISPDSGPESPVQGAARTDNESPGESGQLPVTGFADLIAWNPRISALQASRGRPKRAKKLYPALR
jgi:hypothetical protein